MANYNNIPVYFIMINITIYQYISLFSKLNNTLVYHYLISVDYLSIYISIYK